MTGQRRGGSMVRERSESKYRALTGRYPASKAILPIGLAPEASREMIDERADLHRNQPIARINGVDRAGRRLPGAKHATQRARTQRLGHCPNRQQDSANAVQRHPAQHLCAVAAEAPAYRHPHLAPFAGKTPFVAPAQQAGAEAIGVCKVARLARRPMLLEIGRRGAEDAPVWRQLAHDERRIHMLADTDRQVEPSSTRFACAWVNVMSPLRSG